jgi:hypothetical protein
MMGSFEHFEVIRTTGGQEQREQQVGDETMHIMFDVNLLPRGAGGSLTDDDGVLYVFGVVILMYLLFQVRPLYKA